MADSCYFKNSHFSATVQAIAMKFGNIALMLTLIPLALEISFLMQDSRRPLFLKN